MADSSDVFSRAVARKTPAPATVAATIPNSSGPPDERKSPTAVADVPTNPYVSAPTADKETNKHLAEADWSAAFFGSLGLPQDVLNQVNQLFAQYSDTNAASAAALGYIRGTPWYAQTYPGIAEAIQKGVVTNEADYRDLLNRQTQLYKQFLGRDVTSSEYAANLGEGINLTTLGGRLQGAAYAGTYGNDWRSTLGAFDTAPTDAEVTALGQEKAGLDSPLGIQVQRRLALAQERLTGVFKGTLATPAGLSLSNGRLGASTVKPDVAA